MDPERLTGAVLGVDGVAVVTGGALVAPGAFLGGGGGGGGGGGTGVRAGMSSLG